jgi:ABC-type lipoprotein export system ATPase subunit
MLLEVDKVNKKFGGAVPVHVLKDVDLQMQRGDFAALVGPSGAGKTTLLNLISTLDRPTSGCIRIDDVDVHDLGEKALNRFRNRHLGFIFQDDLLLPQLDALENVMMPGRIARKPLKPLRTMARDLLDRVGLADRMHHRPGELSGGQRQRVNLARALTNGPKLLLADEPTARLDSSTGQAIVELLVELNEQLGVTILMVTHEHHVAQQARRIVEFLDGRVDVDRRTDAERKLGFRNA